MKVYISGYPNLWFMKRFDYWWYQWRYGKYDWEIENPDKWDAAYEKFSEFMRVAVCRPHNWLVDKMRIQYVKIDYSDTWSMDATLTPIILPMLKQLKETKHGSPFVKDEDVPEWLRSTAAAPTEHEWDTDEFHHARWDWVMSEMIWAFEQLNKDDEGEDAYRVGKTDYLFQAIDAEGNPIGEPEEIGSRTKNPNAKYYQLVHGPNYTMIEDMEGLKKHWERIQNGLRLFGVYFRALWD